MCKKNNALFLLAMVFITISLFSALVPLSDFDWDGDLDSFVTEGFLLLPVFCSVMGLLSLLTRLPATCLSNPQSFFTLIVPPPISTE